jgi:O-antigen/teichoic acid export membrane protein
MLRGSIWAVAMRWSIRLIGLVSVVILARLLTPEDFGVVALAMVTIGLIRELSELGVALLVIRTQEITRDECDTAWTVRILQGTVVALVIAASAPIAAQYFGEPRVAPVMYLLAVSAMIGGFENIGMVLVQKELDFAKDFRFNLWRRLLVFIVTIVLAVVLRSYWALVFGELVGGSFAVGLSYVMHAYRPRLSLSRVQEYIRFAMSIIPLNVGRYLNGKTDVLVVGGMAPTALFGAYSVAAELADMVTKEVVMPLGRALFPSYAKIAADPAQLSVAFQHVLSTAATVCLPLGVGLMLTAEDFVQLLLGNQWHQTVIFVRWLAMYATITSVLHVMSVQILVVVGSEKRAAWLMWIRFLVLAPCVAAAGLLGGPTAIPVAAIGATLLVAPVILYHVTRAIPVTAAQIGLSLWRPLAAAAVMALALGFAEFPDLHITAFAFALDVTAGGAIYALSLLILWVASGRREGVERACISIVQRTVQPLAVKALRR